MSKRAPPADNWDDTLPAEDREKYQAAWDAFTCCKDCKRWSYDAEDGDNIGVCDLARYAAFMTPEDYTCDDFQPKAAMSAIQ